MGNVLSVDISHPGDFCKKYIKMCINSHHLMLTCTPKNFNKTDNEYFVFHVKQC